MTGPCELKPALCTGRCQPGLKMNSASVSPSALISPDLMSVQHSSANNKT